MKRELAVLCAVAVLLSAAPAFAGLTPRQIWSFHAEDVSPVQSGDNPTQWNALATAADNTPPQPLGGAPYALITAPNGGYDADTRTFSNVQSMVLMLGNYPDPDPSRSSSFMSTASAASMSRTSA